MSDRKSSTLKLSRYPSSLQVRRAQICALWRGRVKRRLLYGMYSRIDRRGWRTTSQSAGAYLRRVAHGSEYA